MAIAQKQRDRGDTRDSKAGKCRTVIHIWVVNISTILLLFNKCQNRFRLDTDNPTKVRTTKDSIGLKIYLIFKCLLCKLKMFCGLILIIAVGVILNHEHKIYLRRPILWGLMRLMELRFWQTGWDIRLWSLGNNDVIKMIHSFKIK